MSGHFSPENYKDEYRKKLLSAIERKIAGKEIVSPKENGETTVGDLMEALQKSLLNLQGEGGKTPRKAVSARGAAKKKKAQ